MLLRKLRLRGDQWWRRRYTIRRTLVPGALRIKLCRHSSWVSTFCAYSIGWPAREKAHMVSFMSGVRVQPHLENVCANMLS